MAISITIKKCDTLYRYYQRNLYWVSIMQDFAVIVVLSVIYAKCCYAECRGVTKNTFLLQTL